MGSRAMVARQSCFLTSSVGTYLPLPSKRTPVPPWTPWGWIIPTIRSPSHDIIARNGLDAYTYLLYLKMCIWAFGPMMLLTWTILLPVDAVGTDVSGAGLNAFTFGNVPSYNQGRYWAHLVCAYLVTCEQMRSLPPPRIVALTC